MSHSVMFNDTNPGVKHGTNAELERPWLARSGRRQPRGYRTCAIERRQAPACQLGTTHCYECRRPSFLFLLKLLLMRLAA